MGRSSVSCFPFHSQYLENVYYYGKEGSQQENKLLALQFFSSDGYQKCNQLTSRFYKKYSAGGLFTGIDFTS